MGQLEVVVATVRCGQILADYNETGSIELRT